MKHIHAILLFLFLSSSFFSSAQNTTKMQQVLATHDVIMEKMPELVQLVSKLQPQVDSTKSGQKFQKAIDDLKSSNQAMMEWMQGFGERFTADEMMKNKALTEEKKQWLLEEEEKVNSLREQINASIQKAQQLAQ